MNPSSNEYIQGLTSLRGIAAIWVLFFHLDVIIFYRDLGPLVTHEWSGILTKGYLWVDFFFLLSGFIISHVYASELSKSFLNFGIIKKYLWTRFTRIYPLHLFTLLLLIPFVLIVPIFYSAAVDGSWETYFAWSAIWDNLLLIHSMNQHTYLSWNIVSWSIGAEWWNYLVACLTIPFLFKSHRFFSVITTIISFLILYFLNLHFGKLDITFDYGWLRCFAEFTLGIITYQIYLSNFSKKILGKPWLNSLLLLGITLLFHFNAHDLMVIPVFMILLLSVAHQTNSSESFLNHKVVNYLGKISYSVYMIHGIWFMVYWFTFPYLKTQYHLESLSLFMKLVYVISFVGFTIISAHFTYYGIELKCRNWLKNIPIHQK